MAGWTTKMKNFYSSEDTLKRVKRQATEWEEIFVTCMSNNEHISKIFFKLLQINKKKDRGSNRKLEKRLEQELCKKIIQMDNQHMKGC